MDLINSGAESIVERMLQEHDDLLNSLLQVLVTGKNSHQLIELVLISIERLGKLGDRNLFLRYFEEAKGMAILY